MEGKQPKADPSPERIPLIDKLLHIRKVPMFTDLAVRELLAIATITEEVRCGKSKVVVQEGDQGDALYLVIEGDLSVVKGMGTPQEIPLARIGANDFFGEMALFDREPRSASVLAEGDASLLRIEGDSFTRLMKRHPAIPINICLVFSQRTRALHGRLPNAKEVVAETGKL
jgi:CRP-like cAMP-binding protein